MVANITYAPVIKPVTANKKLVCVALKWTDNAGTPLDTVAGSGTKTAANFKRLSLGNVVFDSSAHNISVPFTHTSGNVGPAVANAKSQLEAKGFKDSECTWVMVNNNAQTNSHSAGNTSNLLDALTTTFYHEVGRTDPINLGSSGAFKDGQYLDQADGTTFMGHFASDELTACQLYGLGWLGNQQMAVYDPASGAQQFTIYGLNQAIGTNNLMAVMMDDGVSQKPLFISRPTYNDGSIKWTLHLGVGPQYRGSERVEVFGKTVTYQGLTFTEVSSDASTATIEIKKAV